MRLYALFRLAFAAATPLRVNLATHRNSQAHSSKGTPSWPPEGDDTLTACKPTVSGTISLPSRGTFHHSLTVLSAIGHRRYSGLPGGPGRFTADSTSPLLLGDMINDTHTQLHVQDLHHLLRCAIPSDFRYHAHTPPRSSSP